MPLALPLYLVQSVGMPRNHHALVLCTDADGAGRKFHVTGNIQQGMMFESTETEPPHQSSSFLGMTQLGWVAMSDLQRVEPICRSNPVPAKQFEGPKRIDPRTPLRRCQEWTLETIGMLKNQQVLRPLHSHCQNEHPFTSKSGSGGLLAPQQPVLEP